jgi:hypothetical protein
MNVAQAKPAPHSFDALLSSSADISGAKFKEVLRLLFQAVFLHSTMAISISML